MTAQQALFDAASWLDTNPQITHLRTACFDLNGLLRGKIVPRSQLGKILSGGIRMPLSTVNLDIWGRDIDGSKWVFASGDADGACRWTGRGPLPVNWMRRATALLPLSLTHDDCTPFEGDPRNVLDSILGRLAALNITPVSAFELKFYLVDPNAGENTPQGFAPAPGASAHRLHDSALALGELDSYDSFVNDIYDACRQQNIAIDTFVSKPGIAQFEVNLLHSEDALRAADDAALFKHLAKGVAGQHGLVACFMAKPFPDQPGSGMHVHISLLNADGHNIFDDQTDQGSDYLRNAIAGALLLLPESMLVFAPHQNSYRRFRTESHAPNISSWGYENRTAAIRIPYGANSQPLSCNCGDLGINLGWP